MTIPPLNIKLKFLISYLVSIPLVIVFLRILYSIFIPKFAPVEFDLNGINYITAFTCLLAHIVYLILDKYKRIKFIIPLVVIPIWIGLFMRVINSYFERTGSFNLIELYHSPVQPLEYLAYFFICISSIALADRTSDNPKKNLTIFSLLLFALFIWISIWNINKGYNANQISSLFTLGLFFCGISFVIFFFTNLIRLMKWEINER